ncbi:TetR family transcriptional regulator [Mycobacterium sp. NBC_00419]|uniref:TetR family transcriptional regulator n=1 Tax=Mycobacterium sp. NBC_00419 TaxID=2975989 RepID=UPI002E1F3983
MRNATELRNEILAAARAEFAQHGLAGARIDRIAKAAPASKERLYAHFGDKETLFRAVVARDTAEFFQAVTLRPDAVAEFVGEIYDLAREQPEHVRMNNWARLEGVVLDEPQADGHSVVDDTVEALRVAQDRGYVDPVWQPFDLLMLLFGIGLAWAHSPDPNAVSDDPAVVARRRAAAVEAAARVIAVRA